MDPLTQNIYITGAEQGSGKSVIMLGMMEMLSGHAEKVGFFRPIVHKSDEKDELIQLITYRYQLDWPYPSLYGCTDEEAHRLLSENRYADLLKIILGKYQSLKSQCDHVLCVGSDYHAGDTLFEFDFNADVANNLDCLIMPVLQGGGRNNTEISDVLYSIRHDIQENDCDVLAVVINSVATNQVEALRSRLSHISHASFPIYVVPSEPSLERPTIGDIARFLKTKTFSPENEILNLEVTHYKVAAMRVPHFLGYLEKGDLVITPGDRSDIILACLMAYHSKNYPQISGLLLTGNLEPEQPIQHLIAGLGALPFAVLGVETDTFTTAMNVEHVNARIYSQNDRKIAIALALIETNINMTELRERLLTRKTHRVTPIMFEYELMQRAKASPRHIVLPEGSEERILRAAEILLLRGAVKLTLLGDEDKIRKKINSLALQLDDITIINPLTSELRQLYANTYLKLREHKGVVFDMAYDRMSDVSYFGTMMVHLNHADGMVSGAVHTTQHTIRPAFEIIKTRPETSIVSSVFFMCMEDRVLVYGDCAVNPDPNAQELADIAISAAQTASMFNIIPRIAMLSYSTGDSGKGLAVDKVREAVKLAKLAKPELKLEGPIQYDAAVDANVARTKLPDSDVAGQATVLIFPDLNTGNNTYKAVQRSSGAVAIGPVLQGLNKPVNDLSRGCTVTDIVNTVVITAIQAQQTQLKA
jgi:phosphate acetyltransferase